MRTKVFNAFFALALVLMCIVAIPAVSAPAYAANETGGSTVMTYEVASTYTVTIPATIDISTAKTGTITVGVSENAKIPYGDMIEVKLSATNNNFKLVNGNDELAYTVKNEAQQEIAANGVILTHKAGIAEAADEALTVSFTADPKYSGSYTDTVTFAIEVVDEPEG